MKRVEAGDIKLSIQDLIIVQIGNISNWDRRCKMEDISESLTTEQMEWHQIAIRRTECKVKNYIAGLLKIALEQNQDKPVSFLRGAISAIIENELG